MFLLSRASSWLKFKYTKMNSFASVISHSLVSYYLMCLQEQGLASPFLPSILNSPSFYVPFSVWHAHPQSHIPSKSPSPQTPGWQKTVNAMPWCEFCMCWSVYGHPRGKTPALGTAQNPILALLHVPDGCAGAGSWGFLLSVTCHGQRAVAFSSDSSPSVIKEWVLLHTVYSRKVVKRLCSNWLQYWN